jgi:hypothetical protein
MSATQQKQQQKQGSGPPLPGEEPAEPEPTFAFAVHNASSEFWGDQGCARICRCIMEANKSIMQQIIENRFDLLDLLPIEDLQEPDPDSGLSAAYLAIYFDKPKMIRYLHNRGVDLTKPCDPMGFGNCVFYCVSYGRYDILELLELLEYDIVGPCDEFEQTPMQRAEMMNNSIMMNHLEFLSARRKRAYEFMTKNCMRYRCMVNYRRTRKKIIDIQRVIRGFIHRCRAKDLKEIVREEKRKQKELEARQRTVAYKK